MNVSQNPGPETGVISIKETARILGLPPATVYYAARRGEIPTIRIGKRLLVPRAPLDRMLGRTLEAAP